MRAGFADVYFGEQRRDAVGDEDEERDSCAAHTLSRETAEYCVLAVGLQVVEKL